MTLNSTSMARPPAANKLTTGHARAGGVKHLVKSRSDSAGARTLMKEIDELLKRRPDLGTLVDEAEALRAQVSRRRGTGSPGASALTAAELRVLPLLATHLRASEIAIELFVSL